MIALDVTAVVSAIVTLAGVIFSFFNSRRDSNDHRLDTFVDQIAKDNEVLRSRMDEADEERRVLHREVMQARWTLAEQSTELYFIRTRETELREWARDVMAWCAHAVGVVQGLGGTIPQPPPLPRMYAPDQPDTPEDHHQ